MKFGQRIRCLQIHLAALCSHFSVMGFHCTVHWSAAHIKATLNEAAKETVIDDNEVCLTCKFFFSFPAKYCCTIFICGLNITFYCLWWIQSLNLSRSTSPFFVTTAPSPYLMCKVAQVIKHRASFTPWYVMDKITQPDKPLRHISHAVLKGFLVIISYCQSL